MTGLLPVEGRVLIKSKNGQECDTLKIWQAGKPTAVKLEQTSLEIPMAGWNLSYQSRCQCTGEDDEVGSFVAGRQGE